MKFLLLHPIRWFDRWWEIQQPKHRLDRNPANLCMICGLILSSSSIIIQGPSTGSALIEMGDSLQIAMCCCIFGGLLIKLYGVVMCSRWFKPNASLRKCYQKGYQGAPVASAGLFVYGYFLLANTGNWLSALGAVLTPALGIGVLLQGGLYWLEARRIEHVEKAMTGIALQVKEIGLHSDADGTG